MFDLIQHAVKTGEKLGARFVEARVDDLSSREISTEMSEVKDVKTMRRVGVGVTVWDEGARGYSFATQIIVSSVRHPQHVYEAALLGADVATIPFKVLEQLIKHPLTDAGIKSFLADWEKVEKK